MSCDNVHEMVSSLLDRRVTEREEESILAHLGSCRHCGAEFESMQELRAALRDIDQPVMPAGLSAKLRVLASHERVRRLSRVSLPARAEHWASWMRLAFDNLMRPLALPFAGGILSALVIFAMLVPTLAFPHNYRNDVPLWMILTNPALEEMNPVSAGGEIVVELTIDERGRVTDYTITRGKPTAEQLNDLILFSRFAPATVFGHPTWGKVVFRRSQISVQG
jgi:hypothetical protein